MPTDVVTALAGASAAVTLAALDAAGVESQAEADALIADVLVLADRWHRGEIEIGEVEDLTTPRERFLAARFVRPHPPALAALFEALVVRGEGAIDRHGCVVGREQAAAVPHRIVWEDGVRRIAFTATADELRRTKPGDPKPADRSGLAQRPAWRTGLPTGEPG